MGNHVVVPSGSSPTATLGRSGKTRPWLHPPTPLNFLSSLAVLECSSTAKKGKGGCCSEDSLCTCTGMTNVRFFLKKRKEEAHNQTCNFRLGGVDDPFQHWFLLPQRQICIFLSPSGSTQTHGILNASFTKRALPWLIWLAGRNAGPKDCRSGLR